MDQQTTLDYAAIFDQLRDHPGVDCMRRIAEGRLPQPTMCDTLNFRFTAAHEGEIRITGTPLDSMCNPIGMVHGGWYGVLLDSAMTCAVLTRLSAGLICTTLEFKANIIRAIPTGTEVTCIGRTSHVGRSTGVATAEVVRTDTGDLCATGSTTCIVMPVPPAA